MLNIFLILQKIYLELRYLRSELEAVGQQSIDALAMAKEIRQLVGPFGTPLPDGTVLVQSLFGIKYIIDPMDMIMSPQLIVYRQWEADLSAMLVHAATKDSSFVDVGANFGYFSCLMGSKIGNSGKGCVWAIEPNPDCFKLLETNTMINWSMSPVNTFSCAAGALAGNLEFIVPKNRAANGSFFVKDQNFQSIDAKIFDVPVLPLDSILPEEKIVDLMKIDVEGHEYSVLAGAKNTIARSNQIRIVMEWSPAQMIVAGYSVSEMYNLIAALGLQAYLSSGSLRPDDSLGKYLDRDALMSHPYDNIILKHP